MVIDVQKGGGQIGPFVRFNLEWGGFAKKIKTPGFPQKALD